MRTGRINDPQARAALDLATDLDICAAQNEEDRLMERDEIDRLIEEVDRELANEARAVTVRLSRSFTDATRARRAERRAMREQLTAMSAHPLLHSGKAGGVGALLSDRDGGEVAA